MKTPDRLRFLLYISLLVSPASAQLPRPYTFGGLSLSKGGGFEPTADTLGAGFSLEKGKVAAMAEVSADNARKRDSGTGHDLFMKARAFYGIRNGWYFGAGVQQSRLITIDYSKQAWRPAFGGGRDFVRETFSFRAQALYILPGTDHLNASQGPEFTMWLPSPASKAHWLYREVIGIYEFHQTAVPGDPGTEYRHLSCSADFTIQYRF
jgi:hypothetical protein